MLYLVNYKTTHKFNSIGIDIIPIIQVKSQERLLWFYTSNLYFEQIKIHVIIEGKYSCINYFCIIWKIKYILIT